VQIRSRSDYRHPLSSPEEGGAPRTRGHRPTQRASLGPRWVGISRSAAGPDSVKERRSQRPPARLRCSALTAGCENLLGLEASDPSAGCRGSRRSAASVINLRGACRHRLGTSWPEDTPLPLRGSVREGARRAVRRHPLHRLRGRRRRRPPTPRRQPGHPPLTEGVSRRREPTASPPNRPGTRTIPETRTPTGNGSCHPAAGGPQCSHSGSTIARLDVARGRGAPVGGGQGRISGDAG
jgi:hypothetical protein